jgi:nucleoside-diphosphate-sugar epimerase
MKILITGADGFIGKTLSLRIGELAGHSAVLFTRNNTVSELSTLLDGVDAVTPLRRKKTSPWLFWRRLPKRRKTMRMGEANL